MTNYTLNHEAKAILLTEAFEEKTHDIDNPECETLKKVKEMFPDYAVKVVKSKGKKTFKNLTFEVMELYITKTRKEESVLVDFNKVKEYYKGETARYSLVKSWFLKRYPNITKKEIDDLQTLARTLEIEVEKKAKKIADENANRLADDIIRLIDKANANKPADNVTEFPATTVSTDEEQAVSGE